MQTQKLYEEIKVLVQKGYFDRTVVTCSELGDQHLEDIVSIDYITEIGKIVILTRERP